MSHHVPVQVEFFQSWIGGQRLPVVLTERNQAPFKHHFSGCRVASTGQGLHRVGLLDDVRFNLAIKNKVSEMLPQTSPTRFLVSAALLAGVFTKTTTVNHSGRQVSLRLSIVLP